MEKELDPKRGDHAASLGHGGHHHEIDEIIFTEMCLRIPVAPALRQAGA